MTRLADLPRAQEPSSEFDLAGAIVRVLEESPAPLTLPRIRMVLPWPWRTAALETLGEVLQRQLCGNVIYCYPRYRSQHERYWTRPHCRHLEDLLRQALENGPLTWNDIRRRLPEYARMQAEPVLEEMLAQGRMFRHPSISSRTGARFGLTAPDVRLYVRPELDLMFRRLAKQGFTLEQMRLAAMDLLHEEEFRSDLLS
jgi:hypothetical protein